MAILLLLNLLAGASAFLMNYRVIKFRNLADSFCAFFILYFAQIVFCQLLLGIFGILYLRNLILLNLALFLLVCLLVRGKKSSFDPPDLKETLTWFSLDKVALLAACFILGFGLVKLYINLLNPPFGWDDLNYHFTFPVEWLKNANLENPITISDDPSPPYYPINGSLFFFWLILPLKNVMLADLAQIPFFILAFLSVYGLCRKLNIGRLNSYFAAALFTLIPNYFKQTEIAYVDVMTASLFLAALNYLFLLNAEFSFAGLVLFALSFGLFLGIKTTALSYSILLLVPFIYICLKYKKFRAALSVLILATVIFGSFSYIRNFAYTHNPLYPLDLKIFGKDIFKGVMDMGVYRVHFKESDWSLAKLFFHEGLGAQSLVFIAPGLLLALPVYLIQKRKKIDFPLLYFTALPLFIYLIYRYVIPLANTRYLYPLLGVGMVAGFYVAENLRVPKKILYVLIVVSILSSVPEIAGGKELAASFILSGLFIYPLFKAVGKMRQGKIRPAVFIYTCVALGIIQLFFCERIYTRNEYPGYSKMVKYSGFWPEATEAWDWLNNNTEGNNVAYVGRPVPFPLYGTNFKNNVYYVSVNKTDPAKLHYFKNSRYRWGYDFLSLHRNLEEEGNYRSDADYSVWLRNLTKRNTDYLFIYSLHQIEDVIFPMEEKWAKNNPGIFNLAFQNSTIHIYRMRK